MKPEEVEAKKKELREVLAKALACDDGYDHDDFGKMEDDLKQAYLDFADILLKVLAPIIGIVDWEAPKLTRADYYTKKDSPHYELAGWHPAYRIE